MSTALRGAGQTSWQMPQPVQMSATTMGMPRSFFMAPDTGQRSTQAEQNEVSAMQKRPCTMATFATSAASSLLTTGAAAGATLRSNGWRKAAKNPRLDKAALMDSAAGLQVAREQRWALLSSPHRVAVRT
jgi:hypothetical protein